jgi:RNA polymerase sigma-70 factor (ECF subfamily)
MDHDDLVQITFENIIKTLIERRFANACKLTTWASAIAGHVGVDALRSLYRENRALATLTDHDSRIHGQPGRSVEQSIEARSELERVQSILGRMSKDQARAVVLHDVLGHDLSEVAVIAGVSISAAQSRLFRGRREMLRRAARS